jgi:hypothetical protein
MPMVPVQLPPGLERNNTPYDSPDRWWDCNLIRWQSGSIEPIKGNDRLTASPLNGAVRKIHVYRDNSNSRYALVGTANKLYVDTGSYVDITPASFTPLSSIGTNGGFGTFEYSKYAFGTARPAPSPAFSPMAYWTFSNWGEDIILTANSDGRLFYYTTSTSSTAPALVSTAPTGVTASIVTDERHVMAFGYGSGTGASARTVAWSSREDYTDWNFASTTNTAGYQALNTRTPLLKGVKVKEGVLIFSLSDIFLAQYVGTPYVYGFNRIADTEMFHPDGIATFDGKAVWLSRLGFQIYSGGFVQPLPCPILNDIMAEFDPTYGPTRIHASHNGVYPEIWFFYPTTGNSECNRYVIWNYAENWWAWGFMPRSAMSPAEVWKYPYMGASDGNMYQHEVGYTDAGSTRVGQVFAESAALGIGNGDGFIEVKQVLPATNNGTSNLSINFYGRNTPEGAERVFGPYTPRADGYVDTRVNAREVRIRYNATKDADFAIGKTRFDVSQGEGR